MQVVIKLPGDIRSSLHVFHQCLDPVPPYSCRHGRQCAEPARSLEDGESSFKIHIGSRFIAMSTILSYMDLEAIVLMELLLRHLEALAQVHFAFLLRRLAGGKKRPQLRHGEERERT